MLKRMNDLDFEATVRYASIAVVSFIVAFWIFFVLLITILSK